MMGSSSCLEETSAYLLLAVAPALVPLACTLLESSNSSFISKYQSPPVVQYVTAACTSIPGVVDASVEGLMVLVCGIQALFNKGLNEVRRLSPSRYPAASYTRAYYAADG